MIKLLQNHTTVKAYERYPVYLEYLNNIECENISSKQIATSLDMGEILVRKDLAKACKLGRPKTGYRVKELKKDIQTFLGINKTHEAVIVGYGKLGKALYDFPGFKTFGINISAVFDINKKTDDVKKPKELKDYIIDHDIKFGILTVPKANAQDICDLFVEAGITGIWNFTPLRLNVPKSVIVQNENLAASLSLLIKSTNEKKALRLKS